MQAPLLPLALAYIAGLGTAGVVPLPFLPLLLGGGGLCLTAGIALWRDRPHLATVMILLTAMASGQLLAQRAAAPPGATHLMHHLPPGPVVVEAEVMEQEERRGGILRLLLHADRLDHDGTLYRTEGLVQVTVYGKAPVVREGDRIQAILRLGRPSGFRNPGAFDHPAFLARDGIHVTGRGRGSDLLVVGRASSGWRALPLMIRGWAEARIRAHLPPRSAALLEGLLLGERRHLPETINERFRTAGIYHLLAISGFNVGLIAGVLFLAWRLLGIPDRAGAALTLVALVIFAAIVGGRPSVLRATVMGGLYFLGRLLGREVSLWNTLATSALVLLLLRPQDVWDVGLQLTFAATASLLLLTHPLTSALRDLGLPLWVAGSLAVSIGAQLGVTPLMLFHFNQLSLVGVLANLFVVPLAGLATAMGLAATLFALVSTSLAHLLYQTTWLALLGLRLLAHLFAALPFAMVHLPTSSWLAASAAYLFVVLLPRRSEGRGWRLGAALAACVTGALVLWPWVLPPDGRLRLTMLDVGQGDAIFIELPTGECLLVDAGRGGEGGFDIGERVVVPFLWQRGVALHAAIMTHADPDHAGGLGAVLRRVRVAELWRSPVAGPGPPLSPGMRDRALVRGERFRLGPVLVTVINPPSPPLSGSHRGTASDENNNSLALHLAWGRLSLLLAADLELEAEADLLRAGVPLRAQVLKVAHHGSRFSSSQEFLRAVTPRVALISVGRGNTHRHPTREVLAALEAQGAQVYRTDQDGAITVESDGKTLWVRAQGRPGSLALPLDDGA